MGQNQLASVVIPAYNAEDFIDDAVKSCFIQTYRPLEIIVVNDGSTDSTVERVNRLANSLSDSRLKLRIMDVGENKGAANALNLGFSNAEGHYICWLSADDIFVDRQKILGQINHMEKAKASWSYYRDAYFGENRSNTVLVRSSYVHTFRALDPLFLHSPDLRLMCLLFKNPINGSSIMIRKECVRGYGQFDPVTRNVDGDGDLWMRYSALHLKLKALDGAPVFNRQHGTQTSKQKHLMLHGCELTRMRILLTLERKGILTKLVWKFMPFFPILFKTKYHFERPLVSEFLLNYISTHKNEFTPMLAQAARRYLREVRNHTNYRAVNNEKFYRDLKSYSRSNEFRNFQNTLLGR